MEARIIELESRLAFQENTIEELNGVLADQQSQLETLAREVDGLKALLTRVLPLLADGQ